MKTQKTIIVALLAFAIALPSIAQQGQRRSQQGQGTARFAPPAIKRDVVQKNIGLQLYSLRNDIGEKFENIDEVIKKVAEMGYKYVETANYSDGKIYGFSPAEFKAKLAANGLFALACHAGRSLPAAFLPADVTQANWNEIWAWWDQCIADHKAAGFKYIITASMPQPETLESLKVYCDYYNQIGEKCNAAGLKFGYHNHAFEFEKKYPDGTRNERTGARNEIAMYDFMLANTDPSKVFFEMDVYWTVMGKRSPVDMFKKYPGRFLALHIKDDKELGESGMVGFDAIFKNIEPSGAKYLVVEVEKYNLPRFESVKASLDYLNNADFVKADYSK